MCNLPMDVHHLAHRYVMNDMIWRGKRPKRELIVIVLSSSALRKTDKPPDITMLVRIYNSFQILMHLGVVILCLYNYEWTNEWGKI